MPHKKMVEGADVVVNAIICMVLFFSRIVTAGDMVMFRLVHDQDWCGTLKTWLARSDTILIKEKVSFDVS